MLLGEKEVSSSEVWSEKVCVGDHEDLQTPTNVLLVQMSPTLYRTMMAKYSCVIVYSVLRVAHW